MCWSLLPENGHAVISYTLESHFYNVYVILDFPTLPKPTMLQYT